MLYTRRFKPDAAFAYVTYVMRIVTALTCRIRKFCAVLTCVARWRRVGAVFTYGTRRFSLAVSEYAWNILKIWWGIDVEDFDVKKVYVRRQKLGSVTSTWSNIQFNVLQHDATLGIKDKALRCSLTCCNTIFQLIECSRRLDSIDRTQTSRPTEKFVYAQNAKVLYLLMPLSQRLATVTKIWYVQFNVLQHNAQLYLTCCATHSAAVF